MAERFTPYEGNKPYIFISYSREDTGIMLDSMMRLKARDYRLWYDEGIPAGIDWPRYISDHMEKSQAVIFFLSAKSAVSPNCFSELKTAADRQIPVICVKLDECSEILLKSAFERRNLTEAEEKQVSEITKPFAEKRKTNVKIPRASDWVKYLKDAYSVDGKNGEKIVQDILALPILSDRFIGQYQKNASVNSGFNGWLIGIAACFVLLLFTAYTGVKAYQNAITELPDMPAAETPVPMPTVDPEMIPAEITSVSPPDNQQDRAIRDILKKNNTDAISVEELQVITALSICGKSIVDSQDEILYKDGQFYKGISAVAQGTIKDLSVISKMYYLEDLTLVYQKISSVDSLKSLQILRNLNVAGNEDLRTINLSGGYKNLETLNISHTGIRSLKNINAPDSLKTVYVSEDMLPLKMDEHACYDVVLVR